jgi:hypothetical protein
MSRTILSALAICALLSAAACTDLTGPAVNNGDTRTSQGGGKDRTPGEVASPDEITPPGDGGGGGEIKEPVSGQPGQQPHDPGDLSPVQGNDDGPRPGSGDEINP